MWRSRTILGSMLLLLLPSAADACPVCFGAAEGPTIDAARLGVLVMLGITVGVLCGFALFFRHVMRASREAVALAEQGPQGASPSGVQ